MTTLMLYFDQWPIYIYTLHGEMGWGLIPQGCYPTPQHGLIPKHPKRSQDNNKRVGGVMPHQITHVSPLSDMAEMDQI